MMKSIRLHASNDLRQHAEPEPEPALGEALVRVNAVGICGSDLHWVAEGGIGDADLKKPLVLGHEFAGVIASGVRQGERVAIDPAITCHRCEFCLEGKPNLCENIRFAGHAMEDGGLREFIAWPEECLIPLPDLLNADDGAMLEPLGVAIHVVDLAQLQPGMSVGVFGCGPIGLLVIQVARLAGAIQVYASEPLPHRLETARRLGAVEWKPGRRVDLAFEAAGENDAVNAALTSTRPGGRVLLIGIPSDDRTSFTATVARHKELTIQLVHRMKFTYPRAIQMVESGKVDVRSLVSHHFPLEQAQQAFTLAQRREGLKVIVEC
jgi:L-iditol 2-dehydrogenase